MSCRRRCTTARRSDARHTHAWLAQLGRACGSSQACARLATVTCDGGTGRRAPITPRARPREPSSGEHQPSRISASVSGCSRPEPEPLGEAVAVETAAAARAQPALHTRQQVGHGRRRTACRRRARAAACAAPAADERVSTRAPARASSVQRASKPRACAASSSGSKRGAEQLARFVRGHAGSPCSAMKRSCNAMRARCSLLFTVPIGKPVICVISS